MNLNLGDLSKQERQKQNAKRWRDKHPDYHKTEAWKNSNKKFKENNPFKLLLYSKKAGAKKKGILFDLSIDDVDFPLCCPVLGIELDYKFKGTGHSVDNSPSFDRIDPDGGYTKNNVIVISTKANRIKNNANVDELQLVVNFYKNLKGIVDGPE